MCMHESEPERPTNIPPPTWEARGDTERVLYIIDESPEPLLELNALPITLPAREAASIVAEMTTGLHPSLIPFNWKWRKVYLAFAPDLSEKPLRLAVLRLWILLHRQNADVRVLTWPKEEGATVQQFLSNNAGAGSSDTRLEHLRDSAREIRTVLQPGDQQQTELELEMAFPELGTESASKRDKLLLGQFCRMLAAPLKVSAGDLEETVIDSAEERRAQQDLQEMIVQPSLDPVDGPQLMDDLIALIEDHMVMTRSQVIASVLWGIETYFSDQIDCLAILHIHSPTKRCGKTNLVNLLRQFVLRPLSSKNITGAAIYRVIDRYSPTLLMDEVDSWLPYNQSAIGVLNGGHIKDQAFTYRAHGGGVLRFTTWCPKLLSGIGKLTEIVKRVEALVDRCIPIFLQQRDPNRDKKVKRLTETLIDNPELFLRLRRQVARWTQDHASEVARARPKMPESLNDRAQDNWRGLLAIADALGGEWPQQGPGGGTRTKRWFRREHGNRIDVGALNRAIGL
jgi:hypothetical protein